MELADLQFFGGEGCLRSACCSWHQHSVNSGPPSGIFIHTQTAFLQFPPQLRFPGEFTTNQHFNIPHITSAFWKDPAGKKKKKIIFCWYLNPPPLFPHPPPLPLSCLLPEGEKNISTQRQHCNLFFAISHGAQIEIELDRDIRSARCDNCKRILFKNTLTFVHPVSNI